MLWVSSESKGAFSVSFSLRALTRLVDSGLEWATFNWPDQTRPDLTWPTTTVRPTSLYVYLIKYVIYEYLICKESNIDCLVVIKFWFPI